MCHVWHLPPSILVAHLDHSVNPHRKEALALQEGVVSFVSGIRVNSTEREPPLCGRFICYSRDSGTTQCTAPLRRTKHEQGLFDNLAGEGIEGQTGGRAAGAIRSMVARGESFVSLEVSKKNQGPFG